MEITSSEFAACLGDASFPLAVATSGGMDSLALLYLTHEVARQKGGRVVALTVDHRLRPESKQEALFVQKWAQEKGIDHVILEWKDEKPTSRLQEKAREARYRLLIAWCEKNNIQTLLLGHHQQDQEETFWLRLSSGSGLDGLTSMKPRVLREGIHLLRPLLSFPKERLKETLIAANQAWLEDPSNKNGQFFRGRFRSFLEEEGLTSPRLFNVLEKLQKDSDFIQETVQKALQAIVHVHEEGYLAIQKDPFLSLHPAISQRLLSYVVQWFSEASYPPRSHQITTILEKIKSLSPFTAGRILWIPQQKAILLIRESSGMKKPLFLANIEEKTLWDGRFWVEPEIRNHVSRETYLAPLNQALPLKKEERPPLPARVCPTLPALWAEGKVVSVPHFCYNNDKCEMDLRKFIYIKPLFYDSLRLTI